MSKKVLRNRNTQEIFAYTHALASQSHVYDVVEFQPLIDVAAKEEPQEIFVYPYALASQSHVYDVVEFQPVIDVAAKEATQETAATPVHKPESEKLKADKPKSTKPRDNKPAPSVINGEPDMNLILIEPGAAEAIQEAAPEAEPEAEPEAPAFAPIQIGGVQTEAASTEELLANLN